MTNEQVTAELCQASELMQLDLWTPTRFTRRIDRVSVSVWRSDSASDWTAFLQFRVGNRDETRELSDPNLAMVKLLAEREAERINTQLELADCGWPLAKARAGSMVDVLEGGGRG